MQKKSDAGLLLKKQREEEWLTREKEIKPKENNRKKPSLIQKKNEN